MHENLENGSKTSDKYDFLEKKYLRLLKGKKNYNMKCRGKSLIVEELFKITSIRKFYFTKNIFQLKRKRQIHIYFINSCAD